MKKSLYLSRALLNGEDIRNWALSQGFPTTMDPSDMHVTIVYSKTALVWPQLMSAPIYVDGPGTREVMPLGNQGAIALKFNSVLLKKRWSEIQMMGASHDYANYMAHVTFTYGGKNVDLNRVKPFAGLLHFGGERAKEVNPNWKPSMKEK